jgi:hypothetical protein
MAELEAEVEARRQALREIQENIDQIEEDEGVEDPFQEDIPASASRRNSLDQISSLTPRDSDFQEE